MAAPDFISDEQMAAIESGQASTPSVQNSTPDFISDEQMAALESTAPTTADQASASDKVLSWIGNAANSALFNKAQYLSAAVETPIEKAMGLVGLAQKAMGGVPLVENRPISTIWQQNLEGGREATKQMSDNLGLVGNLTSSVAGGVLNPTNKLKAVQAVSQMSGPTGVAARALLNSAMSVASGTGENIAGDAKLGAGVSVGLDALGKGGQLFGKAARGLFAKTSGLTAQDYKAAAMAEGLANAGEGKKALQGALNQVYELKETSPIKKSVEYLRNLGVMAKPNEKYLIETAKRSAAIRKPIDEKIAQIISEVSDSVGPGQLPDLELIDAAATGMSATSKKKFYDKIGELWGDFAADGKSTLKQIQKEKQGMVFSSDPEMRDAAQVWRRALRSRLEKATNEYGQSAGKWGAGELAKLNKQSGALQGLESGIKKDLPTAQADDFFTSARKSLYTTGTAGAAGAEKLGGIPGMLVALATYPNFVSRPLSKVLGDISEGVAKGAYKQGSRTMLNELNNAIGRDNEKFSTKQKTAELAREVASQLKSSKKNSMGYDQIIEQLKPSVRKQESAGNPNAISPKGATGLFQIMPDTGKEIAAELGIQEYNLKDPATSEKFYKHYMGKLLKQFKGDPKLALAAYNSGPGRVSRLLKETGGTTFEDIKDLLPDETAKYVPQILSRLKTDITAA